MGTTALGMLSVASRIPDVLRSYAYDVTLLQRELLSTLVTLEPLTSRPRVLDVDDAIGCIGAAVMRRDWPRLRCGDMRQHFSGRSLWAVEQEYYDHTYSGRYRTV